MTNDEWELLWQFAHARSQPAFAELARRYARLVYGRCLRQLGNAHAAEDATQAAFLVLSTRAATLRPDVPLGPWLYRVAGYVCRNEVKMRARRRRHEAAAAALRPEATEADVAALTPLLDAAVDRLGAADRQAVLLRYFDGRSVGEVAATLGVTENTAGRRLLRAVGKLRATFAAQGVTIPAVAVGAAVAAVVATTAGPTARAAALPAAATVGSRAAARSLRWAAWRPAVTAAGLAVAVGAVAVTVSKLWPVPSAAVADTPATTRATTRATPGPVRAADVVERNVMLYGFGAVVDRTVADRVMAAGTPVPTASQTFTAREGDAEQLVGLLRDDAAGKPRSYPGTPAAVTHFREEGDRSPPSSDFYWGAQSPMSFPDGLPRRWPQITARVDPGVGRVGADLGDGRVSDVRLDYGYMVHVQNGEGGPADEVRGRVGYDGPIAGGRAVVFVAAVGAAGPFAVVHVWEAVPCPRADEPYVRAYDPRLWVRDGPAAAVKAATAAVAYNANAVPVGRGLPDRWVRREPTGEVVRLLAVATPDVRPFQWWDPDGRPVDAGMTNADPSRSVSYHVPPDSAGFIATATDPFGSKPVRPDQPPSPHLWWAAVTAGELAADLGYGVGPWSDDGTIRPGGAVGPVRLVAVKDGSPRTADDPGEVRIHVQYAQEADRQRRVVAIDKRGTKVEPFSSPDFVLTGRPPAGTSMDLSGTLDVAADDVDHFVAQSRPRHWAHFDRIAAEPAGTVVATR